MRRSAIACLVGLVAVALPSCVPAPNPTPGPGPSPNPVTSSPDPPQLVAPTDGTAVSGTAVRFEWEAADGATEYSLHVCKGIVWSDANMVFSQPVGNVTEMVLGEFPDDDSVYIWRMRAGNSIGWSDLSEVRCFVSGATGTGPMRAAQHLLIRYRVVRHVQYQDGTTSQAASSVSIGSSFPDEGYFPTIIYDPAARTYTVATSPGSPIQWQQLYMSITLDETFESVSSFVVRAAQGVGDQYAAGGGIPFDKVEEDWVGLGKYDVYRRTGLGACSGLSSVTYAALVPYTMTGFSCDASSYVEIGIQRDSY